MTHSTTEKKLNTKNIIIVGGGTAGWMTANILAYSLRDIDISITLIESPDVGIIGVGEGSTPALRNFFDLLKIEESDWMPACNATYKTGIRFNGWSTIKGYESYFHAFPSSLDIHTQKSFFYNAQLRATGIDLPANPSDFYISAKISEQHKSPLANQNFPFEVDYAYHFDSNLLGKYLKKVAVNQGVKHITGHVNDIDLASNHDIQSIILKNGKKIKGDLFVDCTGFKGLLINKMPDIEFVSYSDELHNDSAIAISTPLSRNKSDEQSGNQLGNQLGNKIAAQTESTALKHGWAWKIPLTNRYGNGYVYSAKHVSKAEAEKEFKAYLKLTSNEINTDDQETPHENNIGIKKAGSENNEKIRHLSFKLGRNNKHWQNNCLAVGLSQGFIEPLEATALLLIQQTVGKFVDAYQSGDFTNKNQLHFNEQINKEFDGIKDYIVLHYTLNSRNDTPYWQENRAHIKNMAPRLNILIQGWQKGLDISKLVHKLGLHEHYPIPSWYSILAGYGFFPYSLQTPSINHVTEGFEKSQDFIERCSLNFPDYFI